MSMRLYTADEFFAKLKKYGLEKTGVIEGKYEAWLDPDNNEIYSVPRQEHYPDYILDELLTKLDKLYHAPESIEQRQYNVTEELKAEVIHLKNK